MNKEEKESAEAFARIMAHINNIQVTFDKIDRSIKNDITIIYHSIEDMQNAVRPSLIFFGFNDFEKEDDLLIKMKEADTQKEYNEYGRKLLEVFYDNILLTIRNAKRMTKEQMDK